MPFIYLAQQRPQRSPRMTFSDHVAYALIHLHLICKFPSGCYGIILVVNASTLPVHHWYVILVNRSVNDLHTPDW
jgi:hypothetical protein